MIRHEPFVFSLRFLCVLRVSALKALFALMT
jgi:hypothetical protein